jgi:hypothetical protein
MMVVGSMLPFLWLFAAAIKLTGGTSMGASVRIPGGRLTVIVLALLGLATSGGSIVLAFVPPPEEADPLLAVLKVAGMTLLLLLSGAAVYLGGRRRLRRQALSPR